MNNDTTIDGIDYSQPRDQVRLREGDLEKAKVQVAGEQQQIVLLVVAYLGQTKKMVKTGVNRWTFPGRSGAMEPNIEVAATYGEVRIRFYRGMEKVATVDVRSPRHWPAAKKRIHTEVQRLHGLRWVRGEGWVAA